MLCTSTHVYALHKDMSQVSSSSLHSVLKDLLMLPRWSTLNDHQCILHRQHECERFLTHFVLHRLYSWEGNYLSEPTHSLSFTRCINLTSILSSCLSTCIYEYMHSKALKATTRVNACTHTCTNPQVLSQALCEERGYNIAGFHAAAMSHRYTSHTSQHCPAPETL